MQPHAELMATHQLSAGVAPFLSQALHFFTEVAHLTELCSRDMKRALQEQHWQRTRPVPGPLAQLTCSSEDFAGFRRWVSAHADQHRRRRDLQGKLLLFPFGTGGQAWH
jgi:hypothetical protein